MPRHTALLTIALATLSATAITASAQSSYPAGPDNSPSTNMQANPAPIVRQGDQSNTPDAQNGPQNDARHRFPRNEQLTITNGQSVQTRHQTASAQLAPGIWLRVGHDTALQAVTVGPENTELRVQHGLVNVTVHQPTKGAQILVDLPGGQTDILKDGLYTFNADTNTVRVLHGEALAYPPNQKQIKVKEDHAVVLAGPNVRSFEFNPFQARFDLIPYAPRPDGEGYGNGGPGYPGPYYGYAPYGFAFDGYPYYGYGYGWGDPYWDGFYGPYFGLGFYGGGFYGGGFRGGFGGGGFHGGGGHGGGGGHR